MKKLLARLKEAHQRHRIRHTPTGFQFALADSIDFLNPEHWDRVQSGGSVFLRRSYLQALERACPEELSPRYALIYQNGEPLVAVAAQMLEVSGDRVLGVTSKAEARSKLKRLVAPVSNRAKASLKERVLIGGNLMCWGNHGVAFASGFSEEGLWAPVAEALYRIRRAERLGGQTDIVVIKDIPESQLKGAGALSQFSYRSVETDPDMVLELRPEWRTYEDYVGSLDRKYRKSAQELEKKMKLAGARVVVLDDLMPHAGRMHELYLSVQQNAKVRPITLPLHYLPTVAHALKEDFRCVAVLRDDSLLGFVTLIRNGDTAIGYYIGYDREVAQELPLYLRLLQEVVAESIRWGCKRLSLGRTALEPKARLGAKPEPLSIWIRHRNPTVNLMVRGLLDGIPHDEPPERNPFKSPQSKGAATSAQDSE